MVQIDFEKDLEDILFENSWLIEPGLEIQERQKKTDAGFMDLYGKDIHNKHVIIELKRDRTSDQVIGQISRYMGSIKKELKLTSDDIRGIIICSKLTRKLGLCIRC